MDDTHSDQPMIRRPNSRLPGVDDAGQIIGCGKLTPDTSDDDGFVDCTACGMFWLPELEVPEEDS